MRVRRWPLVGWDMGNFWRPHSLVPSTRKGKGQAPAQKPKERKKLKLVDQPGQKEHIYQHTCFSATCHGCNKVWISAIRPIADNAVLDGESVYLCHRCR